MTINLPCSKLGVVMGDPIYIPREARADEFKGYQKEVEMAITTRADWLTMTHRSI